VSKRGCAIQYFGLSTSNSLEGSIFDARGQPISGINVFLQKLQQKKRWGMEARTNAQGSFHFESIDPGSHHLVVSPQGATADSPYETHIYGEVIQITPTAQLHGYLIRLPDPIAVRTIRVRLTWPDGRSVESAYVMCSQLGAENDGYPRSQGISPRDGVAICQALADRPYRIRLEWVGRSPPEKLIEAREAIVPASTVDSDLQFQLGQHDFERARQR
jgi:hypothetical protein